MHDRRVVRGFCILCCVMLLPIGAWGHHSKRARSGPPTPAEEQAKQLVARGRHYLTQQDYRQAASAFQEATQLDPEEADAYFSWGVALGALDQREEEIAKYQQAVRYDPTMGEAYVAWALALLQLGRPVEARGKVAEALAANPDAITPIQRTLLRGLNLME